MILDKLWEKKKQTLQTLKVICNLIHFEQEIVKQKLCYAWRYL